MLFLISTYITVITTQYHLSFVSQSFWYYNPRSAQSATKKNLRGAGAPPPPKAGLFLAICRVAGHRDRGGRPTPLPRLLLDRATIAENETPKSPKSCMKYQSLECWPRPGCGRDATCVVVLRVWGDLPVQTKCDLTIEISIRVSRSSSLQPPFQPYGKVPPDSVLGTMLLGHFLS